MSMTAPAKMTIVQAEDGASMYIDLEAHHHMGRITLWKALEHAGACDVEILDADTGDNLLWKHQDFRSRDELNRVLADFMGQWHRLTHSEQNGIGPDETRLFQLPLDGYSISPEEIIKELLSASSKAA